MIANEVEAQAYCATLVDSAAMARLGAFVSLLGEESKRQNLISERSLEQVWLRHMADSLQLLAHVPRETPAWLDLGSGAGMPGLIVALARPAMPVTLVESRLKRIEWLESLIAHFALPNCTVFGGRLENMESADYEVISARAFAPLEKLLSLSTRFSTPDTVWLLPKGRSAGQELAEQPAKVRNMFHVEPSRTDPDAGIIIGRGRPPAP